MHHPVIFQPISSVTGTAVYYPLLQQDVALIAAHTNLDQAQQGVNAALIAKAGLPLSPRQPEQAPVYLKFCDLPVPVSPEELARKVCGALSLSGVRISDSRPHGDAGGGMRRCRRGVLARSLGRRGAAVNYRRGKTRPDDRWKKCRGFPCCNWGIRKASR